MALRILKGIGRFWYDFIVGDDWKIAAVIVATLTVGAVLVAAGALHGTGFVLAMAAALALAFVASLIVDVRTQ